MSIRGSLSDRGKANSESTEIPVTTISNASDHPNTFGRYREALREYFAEFFGVMFIVIFGSGVGCQVVLSGNSGVASSQKGDYLSISFGWAVGPWSFFNTNIVKSDLPFHILPLFRPGNPAGVALGAWISGGVSEGHINPAVTLAFATFRGFPWRKVPGYIFAQLMGGIVGAAIVYANYFHAINIFEGGTGVRTVPGTAGLFATYALDYLTPASCFFDEFLGTMILLLVVCAITDSSKKGGAIQGGMAPVALFITILGIAAALGMQTGFAINPARDLGPRILTAMAGYGKEVFTYRNQYWLWCPVMAPILGALVGVFAYDLCFYSGEDSIFNKPIRGPGSSGQGRSASEV